MKKTRRVRVLDYDGMTQQEVADELGISVASVQYIERHAYEKFKRELSKRIENIDDLIGD
jgi:DNA-directed RNA polymerase specialized sigma subunit